ncbi:MAG: RDD family protein, partial [Planctomycetota bacterium]
LRVPDNTEGQQAVCPSCSTQCTIPNLPQPETPTLSTSLTGEDGVDFATPVGSSSAASHNPFAESARETEEVNPYASPTEVNDWKVSYFDDDHLRLATLGQRLGGRILDNLAAFAPAFLIGLIAAFASPNADEGIIGVVAIAAFAIVPIINWVLIAQNGRTIGKIAVGTQIVSERTGQPPGFLAGVVVRTWLPLTVWLLGIGGLATLIDSLFVFGDKRQCLHDMIAQTRVIELRDANPTKTESPFGSPFDSSGAPASPTMEKDQPL